MGTNQGKVMEKGMRAKITAIRLYGLVLPSKTTKLAIYYTYSYYK
jgi:hypothetical protein